MSGMEYCPTCGVAYDSPNESFCRNCRTPRISYIERRLAAPTAPQKTYDTEWRLMQWHWVLFVLAMVLQWWQGFNNWTIFFCVIAGILSICLVINQNSIVKFFGWIQIAAIAIWAYLFMNGLGTPHLSGTYSAPMGIASISFYSNGRFLMTTAGMPAADGTYTVKGTELILNPSSSSQDSLTTLVSPSYYAPLTKDHTSFVLADTPYTKQ